MPWLREQNNAAKSESRMLRCDASRMSRARIRGHRDLFRSLLLIGCLLGASVGNGADVEISVDRSTPQSEYARRRLQEALVVVRESIKPDGPAPAIDLVIISRLGPEAFRVTASKQRMAIAGGDARGLIYGALEAREQLLAGVPFEKVYARGATPRLAFRGIKLNTPWDSYRPSSAIDQHTATMKDLEFWEAWLDMMVENRFNAFTLWTLHPFTYMVRPKNFPEASCLAT